MTKTSTDKYSASSFGRSGNKVGFEITSADGRMVGDVETSLEQGFRWTANAVDLDGKVVLPETFATPQEAIDALLVRYPETVARWVAEEAARKLASETTPANRLPLVTVAEDTNYPDRDLRSVKCNGEWVGMVLFNADGTCEFQYRGSSGYGPGVKVESAEAFPEAVARWLIAKGY